MVKKLIALAALLALAPFAASAATVSGTTTPVFITYDGTAANGGNDVDAGDFNLSLGPISVSAGFSTLTTGSFTFGVYTDPLAPGAEGSVDVSIISDTGGAFSGSFDGDALVFIPIAGDDVADFSTTFTATDDIAQFVIQFEDFGQGDVIQVNVKGLPPSAIPVPAALPLLLAGLGGFGLLRRRQKTA